MFSLSQSTLNAPSMALEHRGGVALNSGVALALVAAIGVAFATAWWAGAILLSSVVLVGWMTTR